MGLWTFLAICVVAGCALEAYRAYTKSKAKGGDIVRLEERIAALEQGGARSGGQLERRVQALEAIVTDPKAQLDDELDKLRD